MKAMITDIKRFAVHDGDGIRTTVFFKGCSLKCRWCHNPETIYPKPQIAFFEHKCVLCGECLKVCPNHTFSNGRHLYNRSGCKLCQRCVNVCPKNALVLYGREAETDEICEILKQDAAFYETSGGGITLSGGECLLQPEACREILKNMKSCGINTAIDTAGCVPTENINTVFEYTDTFLYDIKHISSQKHKTGTGKGNELILKNLEHISEAGGKIEIRIPIIPDFNNDKKTITKIGIYLSKVKGITKIRLLPYHNYAQSKYTALGFSDILPEIEEINLEEYKNILLINNLNVIY